MKRFVFCMTLMACAHSPPPAAPPAQPVSCEGAGARVEFDRSSATYFANGTDAGTAKCAVTAMAGFSYACGQNPPFRFFYGGKSSRLDVGTTTVTLECP